MDINIIKQQLKAYKRVEISPDLKSLSENQKQIIENLIGVEEAHGLANLIQLNFLKLNRVIELDPRTGLYKVEKIPTDLDLKFNPSF
jgi:hypothetical protein